jgi:glutaminase
VEVFDVVGSEPSGDAFASMARLETHGPKPANPLINSGAIALCGQLRGSVVQRIAWLSRWAERLYGAPLEVDPRVLASERATGDRNRALAHFLKAAGELRGNIDDTLEVYYALCSLSGSVAQASQLPALLAAGGLSPSSGERVLGKASVAIIVSLMATCGMYNESGHYLVGTGMPAKSGVSGVIVAVVPGVAGIAVYSPRLNEKGGSVRGHLILRELSRRLGWHFALTAPRLEASPPPRSPGPQDAAPPAAAKP